MTLNELYQSAKKHTGTILAGGILVALSAVSLDSVLHTQRGTIQGKMALESEVSQPQNAVGRENPNEVFEQFRYGVRESNNLRKVRIQQTLGANWIIYDHNSDGVVDDYKVMGFPAGRFAGTEHTQFFTDEQRKRSDKEVQKLYDLVLIDFQ